MATANILVDFNGTGFAAFLPAPVEKRSKKLLLRGPRGAKKDILWKFTRQKRCLNRGLNFSNQK
jgi:hypothetical protein